MIRCNKDLKKTIDVASPWIRRLANVSAVNAGEDISRPKQSLTQAGLGYELYIPVEGLLDLDKEKERLEGEVKRLSKVLLGIEKKLGNENFVKRAPADIIETTTAQRDNISGQLATIKKNLEALS